MQLKVNYSSELLRVLELYKVYDVRYDREEGIFYVRKAIPPLDYYVLRARLKSVSEEIKNIKVFTSTRRYKEHKKVGRV